ARARVEADEGNAEAAQHLRRDVAAPGDFVIRLSFNSIEFHFFLSPRDFDADNLPKAPSHRSVSAESCEQPTPLLCGMPRTLTFLHMYRLRSRSNDFPITQTSAYITEKRGWLPRFGGSYQWSGSAQVRVR